jgi:hypothetical protein
MLRLSSIHTHFNCAVFSARGHRRHPLSLPVWSRPCHTKLDLTATVCGEARGEQNLGEVNWTLPFLFWRVSVGWSLGAPRAPKVTLLPGA